MIAIRRWIVAGIPFVYLLYLPVQSLLLPNLAGRGLELLALGIYLFSGIPTLLLYSGLKIPLMQAITNVVLVSLIPTLVIEQRHLSQNSELGGWMVMGITVILTATAVRQHPFFAVLGLVMLLVQVGLEYGLEGFISYGLVGAMVFVLAGLGVSGGIRKANHESDKYRDQESATLARIASIEAAELARKERLQEVLSSAVPTLEKIAKASEPLSESEKQDAVRLELGLRDEIRGKGLLTEELRAEISRLRNLGVAVALLDEGGMDDLPVERKKEIINRAIKELQVVVSGKVTLRSPRGEKFRLTVVASLPGQAIPVLNLKL
ncbi:MAG: hypothetical protein EBT82_01635 [Micrococcales bacterium]|nr:hypothetical protein [Micrococcales bacterium]NBR60766.1 hypothetical protein [Actinomycetota bacterium]NBY43569.1 hypothetical protein [Micrococcales bacterium]